MTSTDGSQPRPRPRPPRPSPHAAVAAAIIGAFAVGAGATALAQRARPVTFVALVPGPVGAMRDGNPVAVKGQVAELFGGEFVVQDDSGRALVETGPRGEGGRLVAQAETVTVQGRFEHGFIHAVAIQHGDGRTDVLAPSAPPRPGPRGPGPDRP